MRLAIRFFLWWLAAATGVRGDLMVVQTVQSFESGEPAHDMVLYLSKDRLRLDSGDVSSIIRRDEKKTYSLLHAEKRFVVLPHAVVPGEGRRGAEEPARVVKTGKTEQINGFNCSEVLVEQRDGTRMSAWVTADPGALQALESVRQWEAGGYSDLLEGMGFRNYQGQGVPAGFPVRTIVLDESGRPTVMVEVKRVDNQPLKADIFEPPPGYEILSMDQPIDPDEAADLGRSLRQMREATDNPTSKDAKP